MAQRKRVSAGRRRGIQGQAGNPAKEVRVLLGRQTLELLRRSGATVLHPVHPVGEGVVVKPGDVERAVLGGTRPRNGEHHEVLVVAKQHVGVGQRAHERHNAQGVRPAIDEVAKDVELVARPQRDPLEHLIQRPHVTMRVARDVDRHATPPL